MDGLKSKVLLVLFVVLLGLVFCGTGSWWYYNRQLSVTATPSVFLLIETPTTVPTTVSQFIPRHPLPTVAPEPVDLPEVMTGTSLMTVTAGFSSEILLPLTSPVSVLTAPVTSPSVPAGVVIGGWPVSGKLIPLEVKNGVSLPANTAVVEFKWLWQDGGCAAPPAGQGFEVRIWPEQAGFIPMGIIDAADQSGITCDAKSGVRTLPVGDLQSAPGIKAVDGGRFRWDVVLVQVSPYQVLDASAAWVFDLPSRAPTPTPSPTPLRAAIAGGLITPLDLPNNTVLPVGAEQVEFRWRWSESSACQLPPVGYGFELRIWPENATAVPLGAMGDAAANQQVIFCDPVTGVFSYMVRDIQQTPATQPVKGVGRFYWDIALIQLNPYVLIDHSEVRLFELPSP